MIPEELTERLKNITSLEGWCSHQKAVHIAELIYENNPDNLVEIGVFGGRVSIAMGMACQHLGKGKVTGIDPWSKQASCEGGINEANDEWWGDLDHDRVRQTCLSATKTLGVEDIVKYLHMHDVEALPHFQDGEIDFIHIDSNHSEPASCRTVKDWVPKVKYGGIVVFDDTDWPSQAKAIELLSERLLLIGTYKQHDSEGNVTGEYKVYRKPLD